MTDKKYFDKFKDHTKTAWQLSSTIGIHQKWVDEILIDAYLLSWDRRHARLQENST